MDFIVNIKMVTNVPIFVTAGSEEEARLIAHDMVAFHQHVYPKDHQDIKNMLLNLPHDTQYQPIAEWAVEEI